MFLVTHFRTLILGGSLLFFLGFPPSSLAALQCKYAGYAPLTDCKDTQFCGFDKSTGEEKGCVDPDLCAHLKVLDVLRCDEDEDKPLCCCNSNGCNDMTPGTDTLYQNCRIGALQKIPALNCPVHKYGSNATACLYENGFIDGCLDPADTCVSTRHGNRTGCIRPADCGKTDMDDLPGLICVPGEPYCCCNFRDYCSSTNSGKEHCDKEREVLGGTPYCKEYQDPNGLEYHNNAVTTVSSLIGTMMAVMPFVYKGVKV